ncbi:Mitochondrial RNA pseudouridine synthase rpusd4 [Mortierella antarctica]|nr:Mitochondrial RNA pseudouridine synthase rpusd4 [Mortierella antarctica]
MCTNKDGDGDPSSTDGQSRLSGNMIIVKEGKQERIEVQKENVDFTDGLARSSGPVWPSVTYFCIASQSVYNGMYYGVLRLYPRTGRKHQLRVHCAQLLKAPILGDKKYSDSKNMQIADESIGRIHLHMSKITLKGWTKDDDDTDRVNTVEQHPENQRNCNILKDGTLVVRAPLPEDMKRTMQRLGLHDR